MPMVNAWMKLQLRPCQWPNELPLDPSTRAKAFCLVTKRGVDNSKVVRRHSQGPK